MSTEPPPNLFLLGTLFVLGVCAIYAAWRLSVSIRRKQAWHKITARGLYLAGIAIFIVAQGRELLEGRGAPPADRFPIEYIGAGMFLLGLIVNGMKSRDSRT